MFGAVESPCREMRTTPIRPPSPNSSISTADRTAGHDISTSTPFRPFGALDESKEEENFCFLEEKPSEWLRILNLDSHTTGKMLLDMFFPHGANDAFVVVDQSNSKRTGFVFFGNVTMAQLAREKMDNFVPCRQSQSLRIHFASMLEVKEAKDAIQNQKASQKHHIRLTQFAELSSSTPQQVALFIQQHASPSNLADEICFETDKGMEKIKKYAVALSLVSLSWGLRPQLQVILVRNLISQIMQETTSAEKCEGSGTLLGELFVAGFVNGDPNDLALKLVRGVSRGCQMVAVCNLVTVASSLPFSETRGIFWSKVKELSVCHDISDVRAVCLQKVSKKPLTGLSPLAAPFIYNPVWVPPSEPSPLTKHRAEEARVRTVYVSRLSPTVPKQAFYDILSSCGDVNKVRVCADPGYATLYGFVEMSSIEAAQRLILKDRMELCGSQLRLQIAKSPIQDVDASDAIDTPTGLRLRPCQYGCGEPVSSLVMHGAAIRSMK